jgi:hypothetical protein
MAHRKEEYSANGHEVIIQQVNEGGGISAWIDGYAAHIHDAMDAMAESDRDIETDISDKVKHHLSDSEEWHAIKATLAWMCDCHVYYCKKCERFYDSNEVVGTGFAGHKCTWCDAEDKRCPDNPDGDSHEDRCLNPSDKHNARVATRYKCKHCGRKRSTTPTG